MSKIRAADLIERLRHIYGAGTHLPDPDLAAKLPISLSTVSRWKKGDTAQFDAIITMLDEAKLLSTDAGEPMTSAAETQEADPQAMTLVGVAAILDNQAEALRVLGVPEDRIARPQLLPATSQASSRRRKR